MAAFDIERGGKTYRCERVVTGKRVQRQMIIVYGIGQKPDPANYGGPRGHPIGSMESTARLIAGEIIRENPAA